MGAGQGFERGVNQFSQNVMQGLRLGLQQKRNEQLDDLYNHAIDYNLEWKRGIEGLPPSYHDEEEEAARAAAMRPEIPSSVPTSTPGPLGIPRTQFETGKPVQPMSAAAPKTGGAMGLLSSSMRLPSLLPGMRRRF
jgi:hypothetical protein